MGVSSTLRIDNERFRPMQPPRPSLTTWLETNQCELFIATATKAIRKKNAETLEKFVLRVLCIRHTHAKFILTLRIIERLADKTKQLAGKGFWHPQPNLLPQRHFKHESNLYAQHHMFGLKGLK